MFFKVPSKPNRSGILCSSGNAELPLIAQNHKERSYKTKKNSPDIRAMPPKTQFVAAQ